MINSDWPAVAQIYQQGMDTGYATFETMVPTFETWDAAHLKVGRLVAAKGETILGWAALSPVSGRCVYGGVAEVSVYIGQNHRGQGAGKMLIRQLIVDSEEAGLWTLQSGIFPENKGSVELHLKMGFRFIGKRERIGKRDNVWKDNLLFERRSVVIGID